MTLAEFERLVDGSIISNDCVVAGRSGDVACPRPRAMRMRPPRAAHTAAARAAVQAAVATSVASAVGAAAGSKVEKKKKKKI